MSDLIKKNSLNLCPQKSHFKHEDIYRLVREGNKIYHAKTRHNKAGMVILILGELDFRTRNVSRNKEGHFITIKG